MPYYMIYVLAFYTFHATDDDTIPCTGPTVLVDNSKARFSSSVFPQQQLSQAAQTSLQVSPGKSANLERRRVSCDGNKGGISGTNLQAKHSQKPVSCSGAWPTPPRRWTFGSGAYDIFARTLGWEIS